MRPGSLPQGLVSPKTGWNHETVKHLVVKTCGICRIWAFFAARWPKSTGSVEFGHACWPKQTASVGFWEKNGLFGGPASTDPVDFGQRAAKIARILQIPRVLATKTPPSRTKPTDTVNFGHLGGGDSRVMTGRTPLVIHRQALRDPT